MKRIAWVTFGLLAGALANAASFDCGKAQSKVEKLICDSHQLSALDENFDKLYKAAQDNYNPDEKQQLVSEQKQWLKNSRNKCSDEPCLVQTYSSRIESIKSIRPINDNEPFIKTNILVKNPAPVGQGYPLIGHSINGDLVYSHYDNNGNTKSIAQLDFTTGRWFNLVEGKRDPILIAQDSKYIVFHIPHSASFPIEVVNRKTGASLSKIRLSRTVQEAFIDGNRLVLFQGQTAPYSFRQAIAIFELPSLKLIQETSLPGFNLISTQNNRIYTSFSANAKYDLMVFDHQFKELGRLIIPQPLEKINSSCQPNIAQNENDRAVLIVNCGEIHILNLKSFSVEHSIPRYSFFYSMALYKGLIFTTAIDQTSENLNSIVVFDMDAGKEIARLPIYASSIAIKGNTLLAAGKPVSIGRDASWPMETYQINAGVIRKGQWQIERVLKQCQQAEIQLDKTKDLYGAINLCKTAGIEGLIDKSATSPSILSALKQYALWLSQTLDKGRDAIRILDKLQAIKPDRKIGSALNEVLLKTKVIEGKEFGDLSTQEQQTNFAHVLVQGSQLVKARTKTIEFGAFPNLFYFSGDRIYVGRYGCGGCLGGGASIGIFDRNTLDEVASVLIAPEDQDYQDNITSITSDDNKIYASVGYRYEQAGRPNFFVIDKKSLKVVKKVQIDSALMLFSDGEKIMSCGCHFTTDQHCSLLDLVKLKSVNAQGKFCIQNEHDNNSVASFDETTGSQSKFVAITKDYLVARSQEPKNATYVFYPKSGGQPILAQQGLGDALEWPVSVDENFILIREATLGGQLIKLVSVPTGAVKTLFGLPITPSRFPVGILHKRMLFVGYGRDLLVFDFETNRLKRYIRNFISADKFKGNDNRSDEYRINRLIIDQGRLIALTFYGKNSRIIQLADL